MNKRGISKAFRIMLIAALFLSGCAGRQVYRLTDKKFPPKPPEAQIDLYLGKVSRPHIEIARIDSRSYESKDDATKQKQMEHLKKRARKLGADAVHDVQLLSKKVRGMESDPNTPFPSLRPGRYKLYFLRGTAITFQEPETQ